MQSSSYFDATSSRTETPSRPKTAVLGSAIAAVTRRGYVGVREIAELAGVTAVLSTATLSEDAAVGAGVDLRRLAASARPRWAKRIPTNSPSDWRR